VRDRKERRKKRRVKRYGPRGRKEVGLLLGGDGPPGWVGLLGGEGKERKKKVGPQGR
jgi:hypothetical protein